MNRMAGARQPYSIPVEEAFIADLKAETPGAFEALVRENGPRLLRTATRILANPDEAQDCVQETFLRVHQAIDTFRGESQLSTWMHRILVNNCLMKLRKRKPTSAVSIDDLSPRFDAGGCRVDPAWAVPEDLEQTIENRQNRQAVLAAIDELPDKFRAVLVLRDIEEYSTTEAAEALSLSETNLKVRLHRARAALRILLDRRFSGFVP